MVDAVAVVPFLAVTAAGEAWLSGVRCAACSAVYAGTRTVCGSCGARAAMTSIRLANTGHLYSFTIVYRSFPGVPTPFVAAVVDLDGGGSLKGTLIDVPADPGAIAFDMAVRVAVRDTGQANVAGEPLFSYVFTPEPL